MIYELGHISLTTAFVLSGLQVFSGIYGAFKSNFKVFIICKNTAIFQAGLIGFSFLTLVYAYIMSDFSLENVALNSHSGKPFLYKLSGTWGNHEGSLLLWVTILSLYGLAVSIFSTDMPYRLLSRILGVLGIISSGFIGFTLFTSNPFIRLYPVPSQGNGLNPVLQDPGLAFHPPLLYAGYVGLSVPFAFSIAALMEKNNISALWAKWLRPWILLSWTFLTLGITLGSWWAYYELGWGGWWFWDPVENVSLLPWLLTTALLHSARVTEKREYLKTWTVLLSIMAFSLTLMGTFIVRSGMLTSVHAFASDPARGVYILSFLFLVTIASFVLYSFRFNEMMNSEQLSPLSRETALLLNNVFFCSAAGTVLLGTLWPIIIELILKKSVSVGPPFFEIVFLPLMMPAAFLSGIAPMLSWRKTNFIRLYDRIWKISLLCMAMCFIIYWIFGGSILTLMGIGISFWLLITILLDFNYRIDFFNNSLKTIFRRIKNMPKSIYGMMLAHLGVAVFILGVTVSSYWKIHFEGYMKIEDKVNISKYIIELAKVTNGEGKNWISQKGFFKIESLNKDFVLVAERRVYNDTGMPSTETAIHHRLFSHLYIVFGDEQPKNSGRRIVRIYYNPLVTFIWIGAIIMALGGLVSLFDVRFRKFKSG